MAIAECTLLVGSLFCFPGVNKNAKLFYFEGFIENAFLTQFAVSVSLIGRVQNKICLHKGSCIVHPHILQTVQSSFSEWTFWTVK